LRFQFHIVYTHVSFRVCLYSTSGRQRLPALCGEDTSTYHQNKVVFARHVCPLLYRTTR
jgi:hypothetical protein